MIWNPFKKKDKTTSNDDKQIASEENNHASDLDNINLDSDETIEFQVIKILTGSKKRELRKKKKLAEEEAKKALIERYHPGTKYGLSSEMVQQRVKDGLVNKTQTTYTDSVGKILLRNTMTYFNFLIVVLSVLLGLYGGKNGNGNSIFNFFFIFIALFNLIISSFQELNAKRITDKMSLIVSPKAIVIRDSAKKEIEQGDLVLDDIIVLNPGLQIPSDCLVKEGTIEVNEAMQTGESKPIKKKEGDKLLSGSFVVSGHCFGQVESIGEDSFAGRIQKEAKKYQKSTSELNRYINAFIQVISFMVLPLGGITAYVNWRGSQGDIATTVKSTVASMIGMIPFGLVLLTSVALTVGVIRLSKQKALVQDLYSIERLARVDCLCFDKTGTLTDGTLKVEKSLKLDENFNEMKIMGNYLTSFEESNSTSDALKAVYMPDYTLTKKTVLSFSSERKMSAVTFENDETYALGAPEYLFDGRDKNLADKIDSYQKQGYRVVLLCRVKGGIKEDRVEGKMTPEMLFVISDHIRENARKTIEWFNANNVEVKIISGDSPMTVSNIALKCGVKGAENYVSLEGMTDTEVKNAALQYSVFGRVTPDQKALILKTLKEYGKKVAMTGDGVNDILAMKQADCAIAMANGADATRSAAHVVLLNSDFSSMPTIVKEGRRAVNNVQLSASLFVMKTIFTILLTLFIDCFGLIVKGGVQYPFETRNLFVLEFVTIGIDGFLLALQPNDNVIKGNFAKKVVRDSLPGAICMFLSVMAVVLIQRYGNKNQATSADVYRTIEVILINFVGAVVLFRLCYPFNLYRSIVFISSLAAICLFLYFLPYRSSGISVSSLNPEDWLLTLYISLADLFIHTLTFIIISRIEKKKESS